MASQDLPEVLRLNEIRPGRYQVNHPTGDPEGRNIVFSGQLLAQMIMAAADVVKNAKETKSIHAVFARAASYEQPLELEVETLQAGRAWASHTLTATQSSKLMSRATVLQSADEPDLIRHGPTRPDVPGPDVLKTEPGFLVFPGAEARPVVAPDATAPDGSPADYFWVRLSNARGLEPLAAHQAILAWSQPGNLIALAMRPHADIVDISAAHRSVSTGVIAHTTHFHDRFDASNWLLVAEQATWAGRGRVHGSGSVFTEDGRLIASYAQDSMVRTAQAPLDPKRSM